MTSAEANSGFNAVVVYSYLVYRLKMAKGDFYKSAVTKKQMQRGTGLDRSRSIPAALDLLKAHELVGRHDGRFFAYEPKDRSWFVSMKYADKKPWYAGFAYFLIWIPAAVEHGLTPRQNALYWLITAKPNQKQSYYALCLGISSKTVGRTISKLRDLNLLSWDVLQASPLSEGNMMLWQDKVQPKQAANDAVYRLSQCGVFGKVPTDREYEYFIARIDSDGIERSAYEEFCGFVDFLGHKMQVAGYTKVEINEFWDEQVLRIADFAKFDAIELFIREFTKMFDEVEQVTRRNRATGKFTGDNSSGLLKQYAVAAVEALEVCCGNQKLYGGLLLWSWQPPMRNGPS